MDVSDTKIEILTSGIIDAERFYSPYCKSVFNKHDMINEIEGCFKHFHNTLANSEPIIFVDQLTFHHLKKEAVMKNAETQKYVEDTYGTEYAARISESGQISGIYKVGSLGDNLIQQVNIDIRSEEFIGTIQ
jgi:hypothetical protein